MNVSLTCLQYLNETVLKALTRCGSSSFLNLQNMSMESVFHDHWASHFKRFKKIIAYRYLLAPCFKRLQSLTYMLFSNSLVSSAAYWILLTNWNDIHLRTVLQSQNPSRRRYSFFTGNCMKSSVQNEPNWRVLKRNYRNLFWKSSVKERDQNYYIHSLFCWTQAVGEYRRNFRSQCC